MHVEEQSRGGFSYGLGFMRGAAALSVVFFHALLVFRVNGVDDAYRMPSDTSQPWLVVQHFLLGIFNGPACVTVFFVLSGAVLALSLEREASFRVGTVVGYLIKRGFRLYPLLVVAAGLGALLQLYYFDLRTYPAATTWLNTDFKIAEAEVPREFVANALGRSASFNGPAWSIKIELMASAMFPVLYLLSRSAGAAVASAIVLGSIMFILPGAPEKYHYMNVFTFCFFMGALIPRWGRPVAAWFYRSGPSIRRAVILISLLSIMFARRLLAPDAFAPATAVLVETLCASLLIVVVLFGRDRAFFRLWAVRTLAEISYGVYLLHVLVLNVIAHSVLPMMPNLLGSAEALGCGFLLAAATLAVTLPLAYLVYNFIERPLQQLGRLISSILTKRAAPMAIPVQ
jgi:peptidoglycan/LPS O-acetylase OafA/YrhL